MQSLCVEKGAFSGLDLLFYFRPVFVERLAFDGPFCNQQ